MFLNFNYAWYNICPYTMRRLKKIDGQKIEMLITRILFRLIASVYS
jgi:hypothetical protein